MKEQAIVTKVEADSAELFCPGSEQCETCGGKGLCSISGHKKGFTALNTKNIALDPGDTVEIYLPPGRTILAGFIVLILPLLMFIVFFLAAGRLYPESGEGGRAAAGVLGLAAGFFKAFLFSRIRSRKTMPVILRKLVPAAGSPAQSG